MSTFDHKAIEKHGWRQGCVLGATLAKEAREQAPSGLSVSEDNWLIVTSHDCDIANDRIEKEPTVELLRAEVVNGKADKQQAWGRNPRTLQLQVEDVAGKATVLRVKVHERWTIPRELLCTEPPAHQLGEKQRRLIAEWLAKRYIRAAFPTAFDLRWRAELREWTNLLEKHSSLVQGVYLRLNTLNELDASVPYKVHLIIATPASIRGAGDWPAQKDQIEKDVKTFWGKFGPTIECVGVDVLGTDQLTLAEIEPYQRFDADWVSFADDSPAMPPTADMSA